MYNKYDDQLWDMHISLLQGATLILLFCCLLTPKSWYKIPAFGIKINDQQTDILYEQIFGIFLEFLEKVKCTVHYSHTQLIMYRFFILLYNKEELIPEILLT